MARIDNESRQVIGVLPRGFHFLDYGDAAVVMPFRLNRAETHLGSFSHTGVARLKPGVTIEAANADVARMLPIVLRSFPAPEGFSVKLFGRPTRSSRSAWCSRHSWPPISRHAGPRPSIRRWH
jgi:hypothetical protein